MKRSSYEEHIDSIKPKEVGNCKAFQYYAEVFGDPIPLKMPKEELDVQCYDCGLVWHIRLVDKNGNSLVWDLRCERCGSLDIDDFPHSRSEYRMIILE